VHPDLMGCCTARVEKVGVHIELRSKTSELRLKTSDALHAWLWWLPGPHLAPCRDVRMSMRNVLPARAPGIAAAPALIKYL
jgi:hypothetical protein